MELFVSQNKNDHSDETQFKHEYLRSRAYIPTVTLNDCFTSLLVILLTKIPWMQGSKIAARVSR